jgi:hypothetical protein
MEDMRARHFAAERNSRSILVSLTRHCAFWPNIPVDVVAMRQLYY